MAKRWNDFKRFLERADDLMELVLIGGGRALVTAFRRHPLPLAAVVIGALLIAPTLWRSPSPSAPSTDCSAMSYSRESGQNAPCEDLAAYLTERPWFDKFPADPRATYHLYYFGKNGTGAYIEAQNFKQIIEVFFYTAVRGRILYWFPHSKKKGTSAFTISEAKGPGTFDLALELAKDPKEGDAVFRYGSWKRYKRDRIALDGNVDELLPGISVQALDDLLEKLVPPGTPPWER